MKQRLNFAEVDPKLLRAMFGLRSTRGPKRFGPKADRIDRFSCLRSTVAPTVSTCTRRICEQPHETEQRLYMLEAWRSALLFGTRARSTCLGRSRTLLTNKEVPDEVYEQARAQFNGQTWRPRTLAVVAINGWNRLEYCVPHASGRLPAGDV